MCTLVLVYTLQSIIFNIVRLKWGFKGFLGFWVFGFLGFWVSGFKVSGWVLRFVGFKVFGFQGLWVLCSSGFWVSGFYGFTVFRVSRFVGFMISGF